jgi:hypothetical protein
MDAPYRPPGLVAGLSRVQLGTVAVVEAPTGIANVIEKAIDATAITPATFLVENPVFGMTYLAEIVDFTAHR